MTMGEDFEVSADTMAAAVAGDKALKDKFDPQLIRGFVKEVLEYDRTAAALKQASQDNKAGRRSSKKKYDSEGLDTDAVEKILKAYRIIRTAGVPDTELNNVFKGVENALGGKIIADEDGGGNDELADEEA